MANGTSREAATKNKNIDKGVGKDAKIDAVSQVAVKKLRDFNIDS